MTRPPDDQPTLWLKQVPRTNLYADGVWSDKLLEGHRTVARSSTRPRAEVDAVTLTQLKAAAEALILRHFDKDNQEVMNLKRAVMDYEAEAEKERRG